MDALRADLHFEDFASDLDGGMPPRAVGELRIYVKDYNSRIKFICDEARVHDGEFFQSVRFPSDAKACAVARECAAILARTPGAGADAGGWHAVPRAAPVAQLVATLLSVAENTAWAAPGVAEAIDAQDTGPSPPPQPVEDREPPRDETVNRPWTRPREAMLAFLMGQGFDAKAIAADPRIHSTPAAVHHHASRLGLSFRQAPVGQISVRIPLGHLIVIDRAAAVAGQTRDAFVRGLLMRAARDPGRFGLTVVSA